MEDSSQGSRRSRVPPRPESSASSMTRMTPTSSNSSTTNLPRNTGARGTGNSLLQERLRERKVESARHNRRRSIDMASNRDVQSSPVKGTMMREDRRPSSCGISNTMGAKQIEDVSTVFGGCGWLLTILSKFRLYTSRISILSSSFIIVDNDRRNWKGSWKLGMQNTRSYKM
jgi:hypothetical protein